jgi:hypothetical protein
VLGTCTGAEEHAQQNTKLRFPNPHRLSSFWPLEDPHTSLQHPTTLFLDAHTWNLKPQNGSAPLLLQQTTLNPKPSTLDRLANEVGAVLLGAIVYTPYSGWAKGHNYHHR